MFSRVLLTSVLQIFSCLENVESSTMKEDYIFLMILILLCSKPTVEKTYYANLAILPGNYYGAILAFYLS